MACVTISTMLVLESARDRELDTEVSGPGLSGVLSFLKAVNASGLDMHSSTPRSVDVATDGILAVQYASAVRVAESTSIWGVVTPNKTKVHQTLAHFVGQLVCYCTWYASSRRIQLIKNVSRPGSSPRLPPLPCAARCWRVCARQSGTQ